MRPEFPQTIVRRTSLSCKDVAEHLIATGMPVEFEDRWHQHTARFVRTFKRGADVEPGKRNS